MARTEKTGRATSVVAVVVLILATIYAAGYVFLGREWRPGPGSGPHRIRMRVFPDSRLATAYRPAAWIESRIRGYNIVSGDEELLFTSSP
jgi:hypothetical protein